jgi:hypothetical protein
MAAVESGDSVVSVAVTTPVLAVKRWIVVAFGTRSPPKPSVTLTGVGVVGVVGVVWSLPPQAAAVAANAPARKIRETALRTLLSFRVLATAGYRS